MSKPIKFNLILDGNQVRSIEQLRDNFVIEDILGYYREGLLERWLQVRGYEYERKKVSEISRKWDDRQIVEKLIDIFQIETDSKVINRSLYSIEYKMKMLSLKEHIYDRGMSLQKNIESYKSGFKALVQDIFNNPKDMPRIKAIIKSIEEDYAWIFLLSYRSFVNLLIDHSPCAMFCLMMNSFTRRIIQGESTVCFPSSYIYPESTQAYESFLSKYYNDCEKRDRSTLFELIRKKANDSDVLDSLGDNVKKIAVDTEGYFRDFVEKGKKCMVLKMYNYSGGPKVSSWRETDSSKIYGTSDVNGEFLILDGISYNGRKTSSNYLYYMEV